jgi:hypothetical protein
MCPSSRYREIDGNSKRTFTLFASQFLFMKLSFGKKFEMENTASLYIEAITKHDRVAYNLAKDFMLPFAIDLSNSNS